jgi:hypothetical protein
VKMAALALALAAFPTLAAETLQLFPVRGVYFAASRGGGDTADLVDADFRSAIGDRERAWFEQRFRTRFPGAAATIDERSSRRTFAVSLQVARASRYSVKKVDGTFDLLLPVTASLYFTNVATGEVLYAATRTLITRTSVLQAQTRAGAERVVELFGETFRQVVDELIDDAGKRFKPDVASAHVRGEWMGLAVLDAGADQGIAAGDELLDAAGSVLEVVSVAPRYAVARVLLGSAARDVEFRKPVNGTVADVRKPRVLALVEEAPSGIPDEAIVQLFSDALGAAAPVSLVPVNRTFADVLKTVMSTTALSQEKLRQRELPSLFVRVHVPSPISYERPTNLSFQTLRVTETLAYAELVDGTGLVLFTAIGRDEIEDQITEGMALPLEARREVAVKNALLALAHRFETLRFDRLEATIGGEPSALTVRDDRGLMDTGAAVRAFRSIGRVAGIDGEVLVPLWDLQVVDVADGVASLTPQLPLVANAPAVRPGDRIVVEGVAARRATRRRFAPCGGAEQLGELSVPSFAPLAVTLFAAGYRAPFYTRGLSSSVGALLTAGAGFRTGVRLDEPTVDYCVQPVSKVDATPETCRDDTCVGGASLMLGYRIRAGGASGEVRAKSGLGTQLTGRAMPARAPADVRRAALAADLIDEVLKLGPAAAAAFADQKL